MIKIILFASHRKFFYLTVLHQYTKADNPNVVSPVDLSVVLSHDFQPAQMQIPNNYK